MRRRMIEGELGKRRGGKRTDGKQDVRLRLSCFREESVCSAEQPDQIRDIDGDALEDVFPSCGQGDDGNDLTQLGHDGSIHREDVATLREVGRRIEADGWPAASRSKGVARSETGTPAE